MFVSTYQAIDVYNELMLALQGFASHGTDAEIYAYRLMPNWPSQGKVEDHEGDLQKYKRAAKSLFDIVMIFQEKYKLVSVMIDNMEPTTWLEQVGGNYDHRVMVSVNQ